MDSRAPSPASFGVIAAVEVVNPFGRQLDMRDTGSVGSQIVGLVDEREVTVAEQVIIRAEFGVPAVLAEFLVEEDFVAGIVDREAQDLHAVSRRQPDKVRERQDILIGITLRLLRHGDGDFLSAGS